MSQLGDKIKAERTKQAISAKQLAKRVGISESVLLDIEEGNRVAPDTMAAQLFKVLGIKQDIQLNFSVPVESAEQRRPAVKHSFTPKRSSGPVPITPANDTWNGALANLVYAVPIQSMSGEEIGSYSELLTDSKIYGHVPSKVFYVRAEDDSMKGFGIPKQSLVLMLPIKGGVRPGIALIEQQNKRMIRLIQPQGNSITLTSFGKARSSVIQSSDQIKILAIAKKCIIELDAQSLI